MLGSDGKQTGETYSEQSIGFSNVSNAKSESNSLIYRKCMHKRIDKDVIIYIVTNNLDKMNMVSCFNVSKSKLNRYKPLLHYLFHGMITNVLQDC